MKKIILSMLMVFCLAGFVLAEEELVPDSVANQDTIFDDRLLLEGYFKKYHEEPKEVLMAMIKDDALSSYKMAAAVRLLKEKYAADLVSRERKLAIQSLWRRMHKTSSAYVQVEIMHALLIIDRYKYFAHMVRGLIQKMGHYNRVVSSMSFDYLSAIVGDGSNRAREARLIFTTMRKVLFLSRNRISTLEEPDEKLARQLELVKWSIKVLGTQELARLPKEVLHLL